MTIIRPLSGSIANCMLLPPVSTPISRITALRRVTHQLVLAVGERLRRRDGDRVAGVHAHRVEVLDRADDDDVVLAVAHHLELELLPADDRLLDQELVVHRQLETLPHDRLELLHVVGDAAAGAAERETRPDHAGQADQLDGRPRLVHRVCELGPGDLEPAPSHRLAELLAALRLLDRVAARADHLDAELRQDPGVGELHRAVERGLSAKGRQDRVGPLLLDDLGDDLRRDRLDVGPIRGLRIGHDCRRIGVDQDDPVAVLPQRLARLGPGVIELAGLTDHDRPGPEDEDRLQVCAARHFGGRTTAKRARSRERFLPQHRRRHRASAADRPSAAQGTVARNSSGVIGTVRHDPIASGRTACTSPRSAFLSARTNASSSSRGGSGPGTNP